MRLHLFRWWQRTQLDVGLGRLGWLSLGVDRRAPRYVRWLRWRLIAYYSPDATPVHPHA